MFSKEINLQKNQKKEKKSWEQKIVFCFEKDWKKKGGKQPRVLDPEKDFLGRQNEPPEVFYPKTCGRQNGKLLSQTTAFLLILMFAFQKCLIIFCLWMLKKPLVKLPKLTVQKYFHLHYNQGPQLTYFLSFLAQLPFL